MLKLALIENLRRLADETLDGARARDGRRRLRGAARRQAGSAVAAAAAGAPTPRSSSSCCIASASTARGCRRSARPSRSISQSRQTTAEDAIRGEHQRQAAAQVSVANAHHQPAALLDARLAASTSSRSASSSRCCSAIPPAPTARMDFLSRDRQRQAVEELAAPQRRGAGARRAAGGRERAPGGRQPARRPIAPRTSAIT